MAIQSSPTAPAPRLQAMNLSLARNIEALENRRRREAADATREEKLAESVTNFTGSMMFVYIHLVIYGLWIVANLAWLPGVPVFDKSFVILAMEASVEAIFLSTFVLISQNRMTAAAAKRADLDLQINLLTEHELTKLAGLVAGIAAHLGVELPRSGELEEITRDVAPEAVLDAIEAGARS